MSEREYDIADYDREFMVWAERPGGASYKCITVPAGECARRMCTDTAHAIMELPTEIGWGEVFDE